MWNICSFILEPFLRYCVVYVPKGKYCRAKSKKSAISSTIHSGSDAKTDVVSCGSGRCTSIPPIGDGVTYLLATILSKCHKLFHLYNTR